MGSGIRGVIDFSFVLGRTEMTCRRSRGTDVGLDVYRISRRGTWNRSV
jgi:hypothetical protein